MELEELPQFPDFTPLNIGHRDIIEANLRGLRPEISELNFTEMFIWRDIKGISLCRLRGNICVIAENENHFYQPLGKSQVVETAIDLMNCPGKKKKISQIFGISDGVFTQPNLPAGNFVFGSNRDYSDYVYLTKDLIELYGKKYDGKRNLIKQFNKKYRFEYSAIAKENIPECIEFQKKWCKTHDCIQNFALSEENIAALELLNNFDRLGVFGATIKIDGAIEAFTAASELNRETAIIHLEKGNPTIKGIYQTINQMFCANRLSKYIYVNREQDMGFEGLRKAKMSYHPHHFAEKKTLELKI